MEFYGVKLEWDEIDMRFDHFVINIVHGVAPSVQICQTLIRQDILLPTANYQLFIAYCQLPMTKWPNDQMTKWPNNISISSQFSYELDSIELHSCYILPRFSETLTFFPIILQLLILLFLISYEWLAVQSTAFSFSFNM